MIGRAFKKIKDFRASQAGVVLIETMIAVPVMTVFTIGILEFAHLMWQRQQLQVGVRDAARYWSRCRSTLSDGSAFMPCSITIAQNLAWYGAPTNTGNLRVPGWDAAGELTIEPASPPSNPGPTDTVRVVGSVDYSGTPFIQVIFPNAVRMTYVAEMRYIGW